MTRWLLIRSGIVVAEVFSQAVPPARPGDLHLITEVGQPGDLYNNVLKTFSPPPALVSAPVIRLDALLDRFTDQELEDLTLLVDGGGALTARQRAHLKSGMEWLRAKHRHLLTNPRLVALLSQFEARGVLAAGRAAAILSTTIAADES